MRILGISGSQREPAVSGTHALVTTVCQATGCDYEVVSLRGKKIQGCVGCVECARDNVCKVVDDMAELRGKIVEADAYVIGSPNYYSGLNSVTHTFLERLFQFRHQAGDLLWGKLAVAVGLGGMSGDPPAEQIEKFLMYNLIDTVAKVTGQGVPSCMECEFVLMCKVSVPRLIWGDALDASKLRITPVTERPELMGRAIEAGRVLGQRLRGGHDRTATTLEMQDTLVDKLRETA